MEEELQQAKNDRAQAKRTYTRKCNIFEDTVGQASASTALTEVYEEVCKAFNKVEVSHERYESIFIKDSSVRSVKVKALQPPQFSGDIRDFPNFRDDYKKLMVHSFGKEPYALRSCLSGEALNTVRGIENDYDEMLSRLDLRYGDNRKLVDAVLSDLKSIKPVNDGDNRAFVKMVERVERCWLDLQKMDLEGEMNTANTVSYIEKLLPITQKREWVQIAEEHRSSTELFKHLMAFLLKEKSVLEYMSSDIRTRSSSRICHNISGQVYEEDMIASIKGIPEKHNELLQRVDQVTQIVTNLCKDDDALQTGKCLLHEKGTHNTRSCSVFGNLLVGNFEKFETERKMRACFNCLKAGHISNFFRLKNTCNVITEGQRCGKYHHSLLHGAFSEGLMYSTTLSVKSKYLLRDKALLMISKLYSNGTPLNTLWDPGSDITLITFATAYKLGLKGRDIELTITKVGRKVELIKSKEYVIKVTDLEGEHWYITAYGIEEITSEACKVHLTNIVLLFDDIRLSDVERPFGEIELLVGSDWCTLMPQVKQSVGNLQLIQNMFG
ncbi:uncharacterized protein [Palaemon carinicauda]|uniref:uncharacterized protein n=1 Tax=Palaemon carinicauda TaxID=392227 RepID=UPI0035B6430F